MPYVVAGVEKCLGWMILKTSESGGVSAFLERTEPNIDAVIRCLRTANQSRDRRCSLVFLSISRASCEVTQSILLLSLLVEQYLEGCDQMVDEMFHVDSVG